MVLTYEYKIGLEDIYFDLGLKDRSILLFMENAGSFHSDEVGWGVNEINTTGVAWALLDWNLEIVKRPKYGQKITVETWSKTCTKIFAYRDYYLYADGELCAKGTSKWFLIDLNKRMPARLRPEIMDAYEMDENRSALPVESLDKISISDEYDREVTFRITKAHIDTSKHVHNLNYLDMAIESFDDEEDGVPTVPQFKNIRISYQKEIKYGDTVRVRRLTKDGVNYIKIISMDEKEVHAMLILS